MQSERLVPTQQNGKLLTNIIIISIIIIIIIIIIIKKRIFAVDSSGTKHLRLIVLSGDSKSLLNMS